MFYRIGTLLVLLSTVSVAKANEPYSFTGNDLLRVCDGPYGDMNDGIANSNLCMGYIQGIQQFQHVMMDLRQVAPVFCEPNQTGTYENNPKQLRQDARVVTTAAYMQAFPCQQE